MMPPNERKRPVPSDRPSPDNTQCTDSTSYVQGLRRRRAASYRLPVLESGSADPWSYERSDAGYEEAAEHLLELGLTPAPNLDGLRVMRSRGGHQRRTADTITERWGLAR